MGRLIHVLDHYFEPGKLAKSGLPMDEEKLQQDLQNFKFQVKIYLIFVVYTKGYQVSSRHGFNHVVKFSSSNDNFYIGIPTSFTD